MSETTTTTTETTVTEPTEAAVDAVAVLRAAEESGRREGAEDAAMNARVDALEARQVELTGIVTGQNETLSAISLSLADISARMAPVVVEEPVEEVVEEPVEEVVEEPVEEQPEPAAETVRVRKRAWT